MKKMLLSFLLCWSGYMAQAQVPVENSLLWEITSPQGRTAKPSYLFGTIHLICPTDFSLSDSLKSRLAQTEQVALEVDMDDPGMMGAMMKSMYMKDGQMISKLMSAQDYTRLTQFYKDSVGVSVAMLDKAKPFVLMGPLFNAILACQPQSYEMSLVELATKQKAEVVGLETIEQQMAIFDTIPYQDQVKMLVSLLDSLPQARREFSNLIQLYKGENVNGLYQLTLKSDFSMEGNHGLLLDDRNKRWIPLMEKMMTEKPTFFAVGAAHLGGENGVIALLRKQGYKARPIFK